MTTQSLWFQFTTFLFFWAAVVAFVIGLVTVIAPGLVLRMGTALNHWVSTERVFRDLDSPHQTERAFYRHHRLFGALLALGAVYVIYSFGFQLNAAAMARKLVLFGSRSATEWLFQSLAAVNVLFGVITLGIGIAVFFRPSALKNIEAATNRWFAVDDSLKRLDVQLSGTDRLFARRPRLVGFLVMAASLYIAISLNVFLKH